MTPSMRTWATNPRVLILAVAALELSGYPMTRYGGPGGGTAFVWAMVSTYLLWRIWRHGQTAWTVLIALAAGTLLVNALVIAGLSGDGGQPTWWLPIRTAADILEPAILLSPPVRRWVSHT